MAYYTRHMADQLQSRAGLEASNAAKFKIEAFKPHWELIRKQAL